MLQLKHIKDYKKRLNSHLQEDSLKTTKEYYQNNALTLCERYEAAQLSELHTLLMDLLPQNARVLELGSGSGRDGAFLLAQGYDWVGVEGSQAMVAGSLSLHRDLDGRIFCQDMRVPLPFPDASFRAAFSFAALMHLDASEVCPVLREMRRVLAMDAPFVVSVPLTRGDVDKDGFDQEGRYFLPWGKDEWCVAFLGAGFVVNECMLTNDALRRQITWLNLVTVKALQ